MILDKRSSIPLYAQLKTYLSEQIEAGVYPPGTRIPTELALCAQLELSRPTVRQAIAELVAEGSLHIIKGKGTFVTAAPGRLEIMHDSPGRFDLFRLLDEDTHRRYLDYRQIQNPKLSWSPVSGTSQSSKGWIRVEWIEERDSLFAYCVGYYPQVQYPQLLSDLRAHASVQALRAANHKNLPIEAEATLLLRPAQGEESRYLDVSKAAPVFLHDALFYNESQQICAQVQAVLRADASLLQFPRTALSGMDPLIVET